MQQAVIVWKDNQPIVETREVFPIGSLTRVAEVIMAEPFEDPIGLFPEYVGLSKGEVLLRQLIQNAIYGDKDAVKELLDRMLGKPKQQIESKTLKMTYQDYLDALSNSPQPNGENPDGFNG